MASIFEPSDPTLMENIFCLVSQAIVLVSATFRLMNVGQMRPYVYIIYVEYARDTVDSTRCE